MATTHIVLGPPGTGKTRYLSRQAARASQKYGQDKVLVCSLTRASAREASARVDLPDQNVGTLHRILFHALGAPDIAEGHIKEWNDAHHWQVATRVTVDDPYGRPRESQRLAEHTDDDMLQTLSKFRTQRIPREAWPGHLLRFAADWEDWKAQCGYWDFTDLLEHGFEFDAAPGEPAAILVDEAQDFGPLEMNLLQRWAQRAEHFVLVGDFHQCQPAGNFVWTAHHGEVDICDLDPSVHRLISYDRHGSTIVGVRRGYEFTKAERRYTGELVRIRTSVGVSTTCSLEHRWPVRWSADRPSWVVYLMRQRRRWRVGWCQLFGSRQGSAHTTIRARAEHADALWILQVFSTKQEASLYESYIATQYSLPLMPFVDSTVKAKRATETCGLYTQRRCRCYINVNAFDWMLQAKEQAERATQCLIDHGRHLGIPFWPQPEMRGLKRGKRTPLLVHAANLLPGYMQIAVKWPENSRRALWVDFTTERFTETTTLYSLNVPPYHYYFTNGMLTHNSLFAWRGSDPNVMMHPGVEPHVLEQSYRIPQAVLPVAMRWMKRTGLPKVSYNARDYPGAVRYGYVSYKDATMLVPELERYVDAGKTVMLLTTCNYMLYPILRVLQEAGLPYGNKWRLSNGQWNPLAPRRGNTISDKALAFLRPDKQVWGEEARFWTPEDLKIWAKALPAAGVFQPGQKTQVDRLSAHVGDVDVAHRMVEWFTPEALQHIEQVNIGWYLAMASGGQVSKPFVQRIIERHGAARLREPPRVTVGTVHSLKGSEADVVFLWPDISPAAANGTQEMRDELARVFYVGVTRAREELILMTPVTTVLSVGW